MSQADRNNVTLGLGGKYHIARLQTFLDDLGSVDSLYDKMYQSAEDSANSAINENAVYMQSLEARINLARVEVEKLATAMGEALFTDGMIAGLQVFGTALGGLTAFVNEFGALPITLGLGVTALTLFSNRFGGVLRGMEQGQGAVGRLVTRLRDYTSTVRDGVTSNLGMSNSLDNVTRTSATTVASVSAVTSATARNASTTDRNTASTNASASATSRFSSASRLLTASFGVLGIASLAVGYGIEKLLSLYGNAKRAKEDLIDRTEQENKVYADNRDSIQALIKEYNELNSLQGTGTSAESQKRILEIQNELAKLMPSINTMEDEFGNKVFVSAEQVKTKINLLENQLKIQEKINQAQEAEAKAREEETARKTVSSGESDINSDLTKAYTQLDAYAGFFEKMNIDISEGVERAGNALTGFQIKDIENFETAITNLQNALNTENLSTNQRQEIESLMANMNAIYIDLLQSQGLVMSSIDTLRGTYVTSVGDIISKSVDLSTEGQKSFTELTNSILGLVDTEDDLKAVEDAIRLLFSDANKGNSTDLFRNLTQQISAMRKSGITDIEELEKTYSVSLGKIKLNILEAFKGAGFKKGSAEYEALETSLTNLISTGYEFAQSADAVGASSGKAVSDVKDLLTAQEGASEAFELSAEEADNYVESLKKFSSISEQLLGVTEAHISESKDLISVYSSLSKMTNLTKEQQEALSKATANLSALYPTLVKNKEVNIDAIKAEIATNELLIEVHDALAEGKLTQEEEMTYYASLGARDRIVLLQEELKALLLFQEEQNRIRDEIDARIKESQGNGKIDVSSAIQTSSFVIPIETQIASKENKISTQTAKLNVDLSKSIGNIVDNVRKRDEAEKDAGKTAKKTAKETSELTKITDKYALAQERLNTALAKVRIEQKNLSEYSKEYRNSLSAENTLIEKQVALNNQKIADLKKVKNVTPSSATTTTTSTEGGGRTVTPAGSRGVVTAPYNQQRAGGLHKGIDLDGAIGDRLEAFVAGKVVKTGKTARSGNFVQVLDSQGVKHFYAHLDSIAVKIGDLVDVGSKIGTIGNTGNVVKGKGGDGSHLHYETKNAQGQYIDPTLFVNNARKGVTTSGVSTTSTSSSGGSDKNEYGDALLQIEKLTQENASLLESTQENYYKQISSNLSAFQRDRDSFNNAIQNQDTLQEKISMYNTAYEESAKKQRTSAQQIIKSLKEEDAFIEKKLKAGNLEANQIDELKDKRVALQNLIYEAQNRETEYFEKTVNARISRFNKLISDSNNLISQEENALESLNSTSDKYRKSQDSIVKAKAGQVSVLKQELKYTQDTIATGKLSAQAYDEMRQKVVDLKNEILDITQAIQELNSAILEGVKNSFDIKIDDADFDLSYIQDLRNGYEDTSGDYLKTYNLELGILADKLVLVKEQGEALQRTASTMTLGINELQELEEQLEENALAYLAIQTSIKSAEKAIEDFNKRTKENIDELQNELVDNIIDEMKKGINKAKDIAIDAIDDVIEKEDERHEKVMKQYDNELKAYQKLIDSKRREIDDSDRDRSFDNSISDLETERQGYQSRLNSISGINTFDAKKEREELEKQIADVNKRIAEENYQYEKTLREQQLDDLLESKEEEIDNQKETETESHNMLKKSLNKQKESWQKYYDELLNNEKFFADAREMILQGNFDGVEAMFKQHVSGITVELPELQNKFQSTWDSIAQGISTTVITSFNSLQNKIKDTTSEIEKLKKAMNTVTGNFDIPDVNMTAEKGNTTLSDADLQVILAKFIDEQIAGKLDPSTEKTRIKEIKDKASNLADQGRAKGSVIGANQNLDSVFSSLSEDQLKQVGSYFGANATSAGFQRSEYTDYIEKFGQVASQGSVMTQGDLQVMTAKYIREKLLPTAGDAKTKDSLRTLTDTMANNGRKNLSLISSTTNFDSQLSKLTSQQKKELGDYMVSNSGAVPNASLKKMLESYGKKIASMDSGGMTGRFGSSGGVDGKGGRLGILHENEIINNPLDSERMLKISSVLDNVFSRLSRMSSTPNAPSINNSNSVNTTGDRPIVVNIENMNGTQRDVDNMLKQIDRKLFREKGRGNG